MSDSGKPEVPGAGALAVAAELFGTAARWSFKAAALPALPLKYLPTNALVELLRASVRAAEPYPRQLGRAMTSFADEIAEASGAAPADLGDEPPGVYTYRNEKAAAAVVFVHGFGQNSEKTWGLFPRYVVEDARLDGWDVFTVGYSTSLFLDVAGLWSASPPIDRLALYLATLTEHPPFDRYESLAIVAHSMGGLVCQRALLDSQRLRTRVGHFICFGTPSGGLDKATWLSFYKRQIRDMASDSAFIRDVRRRWRETVGDAPQFAFRVIAGDEDEFVPSSSSIEPFSEASRAVIPGNHMTIASPRTAAALNVQLVLKQILGEAAPAGPWNSARLAIEGRRFQAAIDELWPHRDELDDATRVHLALALDSVGRREDAMAVLAESSDTDAMGTLAGRLKRRWRVERRRADAVAATDLYSRAYAASVEAEDDEQGYYHAINIAFMKLAFERHRDTARSWAKKALRHCQASERSYWRQATEGEAHLILGDDDAALDHYWQALQSEPAPWQTASTFQQAISIAELLDNRSAADRLRRLFRGDDRL